MSINGWATGCPNQVVSQSVRKISLFELLHSFLNLFVRKEQYFVKFVNIFKFLEPIFKKN